MMRKTLLFGLVLLVAQSFLPVQAQFSLDGQYVVRSEYRNGYNRLVRKGVDPAVFIAHRARLQAGYQKEAFAFFTSVQDVRTWGNTPQTKLTDNNLSVHEAWLDMKLSDRWRVKLGRQELNYDNARFLGNLDWALQARAHDFALVKHEKGASRLHLGGGYNQDGQQLTGNLFTVPNQYKTAQMLRYENTTGKWHYAFLFWNDGRQYTRTDSVGMLVKKGVRHRQTIGLPALRYTLGKTVLSGFYYHQLGKDPSGRRMNGYDVSAQISRQFNFDSAAVRKIRMTAGFEILSGTPANDLSVNRSFSPLYGTNHAHNGYMDLFYVGGSHENNVGLQDYFLRTRFDLNARMFTQLDGHFFAAHAPMLQPSGKQMEKYLGTELDLSVGLLLNDVVSLQGGYSQLFHSNTLATVQNNPVAKNNQNWAYLMLIFRPNMKQKFIGILL